MRAKMATNLTAAMSQAALMIPPTGKALKVRTKYQVAKRVFQLAASGGFPYTGQTYRDWAKKWLTSDTYRLMEIDINAAASPHLPKNPERVAYRLLCEVNSTDPIVVDLNKQKTGKSHLGYIPEIVVLDGKHRKQAQMLQGRTRILAWVGCRAEKKIKNATVIMDVDFRNMKVPITIKRPTVIIQASHLHTIRASSMESAFNLHCNTMPATGQVKMEAKKDFSPVSHLRDKITMKVNPKSGEIGIPKVKAGGPGSGRHKENDAALKSNGWEVTRSNSAGKQYMHSSKPGMYINRDSGVWGYRNPGTPSVYGKDGGRDLASLQSHLANNVKAMGGPGDGGNKIKSTSAPPPKGNTGPGNAGNNPSGVTVIKGFGTSEGLSKAWDTRGRGAKEQLKQAGFTRKVSPQFARVGYQGFANHPSGMADVYHVHQSGNGKWIHDFGDQTETHRGNSFNSLTSHIQKHYGGKMEAARDCEACTAAKSMGVLEEPDDSDEGLPSASDQGSRTEASDQRQYLFPKEQIKAPGVRGWEGHSSPAQQSPGSGVGPRVARSTGGSRSEMSRLQDTVPEVNAHAKVVDKIYTKAPPGFSEKTMHELKRKHGTTSAFKIAWSQYGGGK
jgi:hypothetical protein